MTLVYINPVSTVIEVLHTSVMICANLVLEEDGVDYVGGSRYS